MRQFPPASIALACGLLLVSLSWAWQLVPLGAADRWLRTVLVQSTAILLPAWCASFLVPVPCREAFRVRRPAMGPLAAAGLLAVVVHPLMSQWSELVIWLFPLPESVQRGAREMLTGDQRLGMALAMLAVGPVCEELAFRGFLLGGLAHGGHRWRGILLSTLFFALCHRLPQQALIVLPAGLLFAYVSLKTGTIVSSWLMHVVYNALALGMANWLPQGRARAVLRLVLDFVERQLTSWPFLLVAAALAWLLLRWLRSLPERSVEET